ncbi:hypothetical protein [Azospirillum argentinense]
MKIVLRIVSLCLKVNFCISKLLSILLHIGRNKLI